MYRDNTFACTTHSLTHQVCVTLFWLGNVVSTLKDYTGPQLDLKAFKEILDEVKLLITYFPVVLRPLLCFFFLFPFVLPYPLFIPVLLTVHFNHNRQYRQHIQVLEQSQHHTPTLEHHTRALEWRHFLRTL